MFTLVRYTRTEKAILGSLYLNGAFICYTLENAAKAVSAALSPSSLRLPPVM